MFAALWHAITSATLAYIATFIVGFVARHYGPKLWAFAKGKLTGAS